MPFPFELPTTSALSFTDHYTSTTHPSLPLAATTTRGVLRDVLKAHKRLPPASQAAHLPAVQSALEDYIPHLLALTSTAPTPLRPLTTEWRATLTPPPHPGLPAPRLKLPSLAAELTFALSTLALTHSLTARASLHALHLTTATLAPAARAAAIAAAMRSFLAAQAIHAHVATIAAPSPAVETAAGTQSALAELALAEATLIAVLKDDPYAAALAESRSQTADEWKFRGAETPSKVRAHLFARLAVCAGEHAGRAATGLRGEVGRYAGDLRRAARGKACRFLGVDAEGAGRTGEGIAWVRGARRELGEEEEGVRARVKKGWVGRREDRRVERGEGWGADGGRVEEGRVVEMLETKWVKMNDTVGVQPVPPVEQLLATIPSGREYHAPKPYTPPTLDPAALAAMRAPPDPKDAGFAGAEDDSDDEGEQQPDGAVVGAFPGTSGEYAGGSGYY